ncbi:MAG: hypothetical protein SGBAC_004867 [Bacillariaceae sp.]
MRTGESSNDEDNFDCLSTHSGCISLLSIPEDNIFSSSRQSVGTTGSSMSSIPRIDPSRRTQNGPPVDLLDSIPVILTSTQPIKTSTRTKKHNADVDIEAALRIPRSNQQPKETRAEQKLGLDEAYLMYSRAENAALMIQKRFRDRHPEFANDMKDKDEDTEYILENEKEEDEAPSPQSMLTWIFIACTTFAPILMGWINKCLSMLNKASDGGVDDEVIASKGAGANGGGGGGAAGGGGGGGGGGGPSPAQAMAGQAAGAAGAGAAAGVGAAAGAAAGAAGAAAGKSLNCISYLFLLKATAYPPNFFCIAGAAGAGAVASAVTVTAAAAAAVAGVSLATAGTNTTLMETVPILSACGIAEPLVLPGRVSFVLEGFYREFDERETVLLEGLLVEAYNNITLGPEQDLCQDEYLRELQSATLFNQTFFPETEFNNSYIETSFDTITVCEGCSSDNPMFGNNEITRRRLQEQLSSAEFFQLFLQKLLLDVKEMSEDGDIMEGFLQMKRGYISDSSGQEAMLTEIITTFNEAGEVASLTLAFTENGDTTTTTVNVIPPEETTAPTVTVTIEPTTPEPTMTPSLSVMPSPVDATQFPSGVPSIIPSEFPSVNPSEAPSQVPSIPPSEAPSEVPSPSPSTVPTINFSGQPTREPSMKPSAIPSVVPSESPSMVPSMVPSDQPSLEPSVAPSDVPSDIPSFVPSAGPSVVPSDVPSEVPSHVPSIAPSEVPSKIPTNFPTRSPTPKPSRNPTSYPTLSIRPTPCIWRAAERRQGGSIGNGPQNCTGIDRTLYNAPIYIYDQSQEGDTVNFRVNWNIFEGSVMTLAAMTYDSSATTTTCDYQTGAFTSRNFEGVCTNGSLEVIFYFYMCGEEVNAGGNFCSRPSDMSNYREWRYLLDCYEVCETETPTSGPTSGPTRSYKRSYQ